MRGLGIWAPMAQKRNSYNTCILVKKKSLKERDLLEYLGKDDGKKEIT